MVNILCKFDNSFYHNIQLINNNHYSQHLFDGYSISHFWTGIFGGFVVPKWYLFLIISILFEIVENSNFMATKFRKVGYDITKDSIINISGDLICNMTGYFCSYLTPYPYKLLWIILFLLSEIFLLSVKKYKEYSSYALLKRFSRGL